MKTRTILLLLSLLAAAAVSALAQGATYDVAALPGANYAVASFRLWVPEGSAPLAAALVLVPGSNGDGRAAVDDPVWQAFAVRHRLALVGCFFRDQRHDQNFIEQYANVAQGSGQALLGAMQEFAAQAAHPELAAAPFLLWGMSAGGEFNYEFTAWKPERVIAFVVNKGGIYYTALAPRAAREVPGMLFIGGSDLDSRKEIIRGLFALNQRGGAYWALAEEPGAAHIVGRSRDVALVFFEDVLALRLGKDGLQPIAKGTGYIGDPKTMSIQPVSAGRPPAYPVAWLPSERVARAWLAMETGKPFDPPQ